LKFSVLDVAWIDLAASLAEWMEFLGSDDPSRSVHACGYCSHVKLLVES